MASQAVNPAVLAPLQEALTAAFWYKSDLRDFLRAATGLSELVSRYDWADRDVTKRMIVRSFVSTLFDEPHKYQDCLIQLLVAAPDIDPSPLLRLDDGVNRHATAVAALDCLRGMVDPYRQKSRDAAEAAKRFAAVRESDTQLRSRTAEVAVLKQEFIEMHGLDPQQRGYALEVFLTRLFDAHDIDARGPFSGNGEQLDGAFTFEGADYLLEAKWEKSAATNADVSTFRDKVRRRLDNTLGLFVAFAGFQQSVVENSGRSGREIVILLDGADLMAVLEERITLEQLLRRKKQHAARTGTIMLHAADIVAEGL